MTFWPEVCPMHFWPLMVSVLLVYCHIYPACQAACTRNTVSGFMVAEDSVTSCIFFSAFCCRFLAFLQNHSARNCWCPFSCCWLPSFYTFIRLALQWVALFGCFAGFFEIQVIHHNLPMTQLLTSFLQAASRRGGTLLYFSEALKNSCTLLLCPSLCLSELLLNWYVLKRFWKQGSSPQNLIAVSGRHLTLNDLWSIFWYFPFLSGSFGVRMLCTTKKSAWLFFLLLNSRVFVNRFQFSPLPARFFHYFAIFKSVLQVHALSGTSYIIQFDDMNEIPVVSQKTCRYLAAIFHSLKGCYLNHVILHDLGGHPTNETIYGFWDGISPG